MQEPYRKGSSLTTLLSILKEDLYNSLCMKGTNLRAGLLVLQIILLIALASGAAESFSAQTSTPKILVAPLFGTVEMNESSWPKLAYTYVVGDILRLHPDFNVATYSQQDKVVKDFLINRQEVSEENLSRYAKESGSRYILTGYIKEDYIFILLFDADLNSSEDLAGFNYVENRVSIAWQKVIYKKLLEIFDIPDRVPEEQLLNDYESFERFAKALVFKYLGMTKYGVQSSFSQKEWQESLRCFEEAKEGAWHSPMFRLSYAIALDMVGMKRRAYDIYVSLKDFPNLKELPIWEGVKARMAQDLKFLAYQSWLDADLEEALEEYREAQKSAPEMVELKYWEGRVLFEMGKIREGIEAFRRVLAASPGHREAKYFIGKGEKYLKYGKSSFDYFEKGVVTYKKNPSEAISHFRKALEDNPDFFEAKVWLIRIFVQLGDRKNAEAIYQTLTDFEKNSEQVRALMKGEQSKRE